MDDQRFVLVLFLCLIADAFAQDCPPNLATMQNTVVYEGATASFPRAANGDTAQWQMGPSNDPNSFVSITNPDGTVDPQYATTYAVNSSQLKISKATTAPEGTTSFATAGLYLLNYQDAACTVGAGLVVIKSGPVCVCDASNSTAVKLTCSVEFAEYVQQQINPIITWKKSSGTVKQSVPPRTQLDINNYGLQNSTDSLQVSNDDSTKYECQLTFTTSQNDGSVPTFLAQNAPTFTSSCFISNCFKEITTTSIVGTTVKATTKTVPTTVKATTKTVPTTAKATTKTVPTTVKATTKTVPTTVKATTKTVPTTAAPKPATTTPNNSGAPPGCGATMRNTVVYEGASTSFTKAAADTGAVQWTVAPSSSTFNTLTVINPDSETTVGPMYTSSYAVTSTHLTILDATSAAKGSNPDSTAGMYLMSTDGGDSFCQGAGLTVIISGPNCSYMYNYSDPNDVELTCSVEFANYINQRIVPVMTWTSNSNGTTVTVDTPQPESLDLDNPGIQESISYLSISSTDTASYGCTITFSAPSPDQPPNIDSNAPSFSAACVARWIPASTTTPTAKATSGTSPPNPCLTTTKPAGPGCPKNLTNIVVYQGSVAVFENVDDGKPVKWHFSSSSDPENNLLDITDYDNKVNPMFVGAYNVTKTKLTILSATVAPKGRNPYANAGVYFLTYQSTGCQSAANLIVIQSGPVCERNENDPNNVTLSCNISFAESQRQPSYPTMTWTAGTVVIRRDNPTTQKYAYVNESLSQIQVYNAAPSYYQCQVTFNPPGPSPILFLAQNAPSYTESCTVASGTFPPTTEIATTTVCVDRPVCSSKWLSSQTAFCPYVQEFRDDCPAFCNAC